MIALPLALRQKVVFERMLHGPDPRAK